VHAVAVKARKGAVVHGVGAGGRGEEPSLRGGDAQARAGGQDQGDEGLRLAGGVVGGGIDPPRAGGGRTDGRLRDRPAPVVARRELRCRSRLPTVAVCPATVGTLRLPARMW
ncbi:hypothetical protein, partial [Streptomyces sp. CH6]|uniref:hypothetical protein n=1 Tax=unclassified Streptomyces TaxID=2593676 RepID=UPI003D02F474